MIRKAVEGDLPGVYALYEAVLSQEAAQGFCYTNWRKGVYPTEETARRALLAGSLYLAVEEGRVLGAVIVNGEQSPEYGAGAWRLPAREEEVGVLHTLCVHPGARGRGLASALVQFGEALCRRAGKRVMRLDTRAVNLPGRRLYPSLGYEEAGQVELLLPGEERALVQLFEKALL